ncbi:MAG: hypothetical protein ACOCV2_15185 [Persicimonas sp.]
MGAFCLAGPSTGCGGGEETETVFLHVFNGYPGSESLTLYGPQGAVAEKLEFAEGTDEAVEVNRNVNSDDFELVIDGAPTPIEIPQTSFSLYPDETATLMVSRRSGESTADANMYRHTRSSGPECLLTMGNSLSLDNSMMAEQLSFSYQTEWQRDPAPYYDPDAEQLAETRCGPVEVPDRYDRTSLHDQIENDPWFFPVESSTEEDQYQFAWAVRREHPETGEPRSTGVDANGQIRAKQTTIDYVDCLSDAVQMEEEDDEGTNNGSSGETQCPDLTETATGPGGSEVDVLADDEVVWDHEAAGDCGEDVTYGGFPVEAGQPGGSVTFSIDSSMNLGDDSSETCEVPVRFRTPSTDLIFRDTGEDDSEGEFVQTVVGFDDFSQHRFLVVYGRPIDPFITQWDSEETAVDLEDHPYPGDVSPDEEADE